MLIRYHGHQFELGPEESVLDGLLRQDLPIRYSCRAGSCHTCMMRAVSGCPTADSQKGLPPELTASGYFLPCRCRPDQPMSIEAPDPAHLSSDCLVAEKRVLSRDLCIFRLETSDGIRPLAGQSISLVHPSGVTRPYSVATLPDRDYYVELHVRRVEGGQVSGWLHDQVEEGDALKMLPPVGNFVNRQPTAGQRMLLVGTGTGLAPLLAILRDALECHAPGEVLLLHGCRDAAGLYADAKLRVLQSQHPNFSYIGCISGQFVSAPYFAGRVTDWLRQTDLEQQRLRVFAAGHPAMIEEVSDFFATPSEGQSAKVITDAFHHFHERRVSGLAGGFGERSRRVPAADPALWAYLKDGETLRAVLEDFYVKAFEDERLGPFFVGVTQQRLREKQYSFLRSLMLGTRDYLGQRPRNAHHWMVISDDLFDYRLALMSSCMQGQGMSDEWIERWHVFEEFFRSDVVKSEPQPRIINGQPVSQEGMGEAILDEGSLCDGCQGALAAGAKVRFHQRLGTVFCQACSERGPKSR